MASCAATSAPRGTPVRMDAKESREAAERTASLERKLRNRRKKLREISALEARIAASEGACAVRLHKDQRAKLTRRSSLEAQIVELQQLIESERNAQSGDNCALREVLASSSAGVGPCGACDGAESDSDASTASAASSEDSSSSTSVVGSCAGDTASETPDADTRCVDRTEGPLAGPCRRVQVKAGDKSVAFDMPERFELIQTLGSGAYGTVASFQDSLSGSLVAVKKVGNALDSVTDGLRTLREVRVLRNIRDHRNLVRIQFACLVEEADSADVYIVQELLDIDLDRVLRLSREITNAHRQRIGRGILSGLAHLHSLGVVHRDIKPANVLISMAGAVKICDFNLARGLEGCGEGERPAWSAWSDDKLSEYVCTRWYRAPEIILMRGKYGAPVDVWGAGCIFAELFGDRPVFRGKDCRHQIQLQVEGLGLASVDELERGSLRPSAERLLVRLTPATGRPWSARYPQAPAAAHEALDAMLRLDPRRRAVAKECLQLPFFLEGAAHDSAAPTPPGDAEAAPGDDVGKPVDWSFRGKELTKAGLRELLRNECRLGTSQWCPPGAVNS